MALSDIDNKDESYVIMSKAECCFTNVNSCFTGNWHEFRGGSAKLSKPKVQFPNLFSPCTNYQQAELRHKKTHY